MKRVRVFSACLLALSLAACSSGTNRKDAIETKVEALLEQMTLQEKIGQMNQVNPNGNLEEMIAIVKEGKVGSFLNVIDADVVNKVQKAAVKESRLGIPVLMRRPSTRKWWRMMHAWQPLKPRLTASVGHSPR